MRVEGRFACVGRVAPVKGQDVLIAALPLLSTREHPIECVVAGNEDGDFAVGLKEVSARDPGPATVRWAGVIDDSVALLRSCVAMVVPSHREALGRVIFEAWEAGAVPIVYAGSGGAAEIVNLSGGGVLYDVQTGASLAAALESVLSLTPDERAELVSRGRLWMLETCDPAEYARAISAIFSNAASTRPSH
jgi:glycosyltransferase involved in cell wall biosynthesis